MPEPIPLTRRDTSPAETYWPRLERSAADDASRTIDAFMRTCLVRQDGAQLQAQPLYAAFAAWCWTRGERPASLTRFGRHVSQYLPRSEIAGRHHYRGCAIDERALAASAFDAETRDLIRSGEHTAASLRAADLVAVMTDGKSVSRLDLSAAILRALG